VGPAVAKSMSDIEDLEEFARQTAPHVNGRTHNACRGKGVRWCISPNIERASAPHVVEETVAPKEGSEPETPAPIIHIFTGAEITSYTELIGVIRTRVGQLGVRYLDFDQLAGFAEGLSGKVFGAAQVKRLGIEKMFDALRAAGLRIRIEEDPEQTAKMRARIAANFEPRQTNQARQGNDSNMSNEAISRVLGYLANKTGGLTVLNAAVKQARSNCARRAAKVLWEKRRACGPADFTAPLDHYQAAE
jgi:hypothetical protein